MIPVPPRDSDPQPQPRPEEIQQEDIPYLLPAPRRPPENLRNQLISFALLGGLSVTLMLSCVLSGLTSTFVRLTKVVYGPRLLEMKISEEPLPPFTSLLVTYCADLVAPMILVFAIIGAADLIARTISRSSNRTAEAFLKGTKRREAAAGRANLTDDIVSDYFKKGPAGEAEPPEHG
jgi:hypothetical protein